MDNYKRYNICIIGVSEEEKEQMVEKKILEEIKTEIFPNLTKKLKKYTHQHIKMKYFTSKQKTEKNLESIQKDVMCYFYRNNNLNGSRVFH